MKRRAFLAGMVCVSTSGCAVLQGRGQSSVPTAQEGFVVREAPVAAGNLTSFFPEGDTVFMSGSINSDTVAGFEAVRTSNPKARKLVMLQADGQAGSAETIAFGRALRNAGFNTHLRNDSVITGGAIDAFLGGRNRTIEDGAVLAVQSPENEAALQGYTTEMVGGDGYARFAQKFGRRRRARPMTIAEIGAMGIVSANTGNVIVAN